jgi:hypothetical protein
MSGNFLRASCSSAVRGGCAITCGVTQIKNRTTVALSGTNFDEASFI